MDRTTIHLSKEHKKRLSLLAQRNSRSEQAQAEYMIDTEMQSVDELQSAIAAIRAILRRCQEGSQQ